MTYFMTYEQVIEVFAHVFPERQTEFTLFNIKECGLVVALINSDILIGEQTGKH